LVLRHWLPAAVLGIYALAFGYRALSGGLLVFDDHPGQLYRLHHALTIGLAPWRLNPGWWAGYAELQFYPPGFAWLGALIHYASLGSLGADRIYQLLLWIAYLLPGATTYLLLRRVLGGGWLALPGAFLALTLSAGSRSGLEEGLRWGLVSARLAWGLLPLLALALLRWVEGSGRASLWAAPLLAAIIITHPAHAPAAGALILLAACRRALPRRARIKTALFLLVAGVGLAGFWLIPLLAHLDMALPLAWGDNSLGVITHLFKDVPALIILLGLYGLALARAFRGDATPHAQKWLLALAPTMFLLVLLDAAVLTRLGVLWIPPDRLLDSFLLSLVLGAAMSLSQPLTIREGFYWLLTPALLAALLGPGSGEPLASLWPKSGEWPKYTEVVGGTRLDDLWTMLRQAPPGRILFIRSAVPLTYQPEWWRPHSHITALTPMESGRAILNGTFTHPSPIAGLLYTGSAENRPIRLLVERRDGVTLFGQPLQGLSERQFNGFGEALGISVVVALDEDEGRIPFLSDNPAFTKPAVIGFFKVYLARGPRPIPEPSGSQTWLIRLASHPAGWLKSGMAWSPLWRADSAGKRLPVRRDGFGMLEVEVPPGAELIRIEHRPGAAELAGLTLSFAAIIALPIAWRRQRAAGVKPP
jgi:hypothetical protein